MRCVLEHVFNHEHVRGGDGVNMDGWEICLSNNWLLSSTTRLFYWILCFGVERSVSLVSSHVHDFCLWMHALHVIEWESNEWKNMSCTSDYWNRNVVGPSFYLNNCVEVYFSVERTCFYSGPITWLPQILGHEDACMICVEN